MKATLNKKQCVILALYLQDEPVERDDDGTVEFEITEHGDLSFNGLFAHNDAPATFPQGACNICGKYHGDDVVHPPYDDPFAS